MLARFRDGHCNTSVADRRRCDADSAKCGAIAARARARRRVPLPAVRALRQGSWSASRPAACRPPSAPRGRTAGPVSPSPAAGRREPCRRDRVARARAEHARQASTARVRVDERGAALHARLVGRALRPHPDPAHGTPTLKIGTCTWKCGPSLAPGSRDTSSRRPSVLTSSRNAGRPRCVGGGSRGTEPAQRAARPSPAHGERSDRDGRRGTSVGRRAMTTPALAAASAGSPARRRRGWAAGRRRCAAPRGTPG